MDTYKCAGMSDLAVHTGGLTVASLDGASMDEF